MRNSGYWVDDRSRRKPVVDLRGARCRRCPPVIREVPIDRTWVVPWPGDEVYVRVFVCPHCRAEARDRIDAAEALRLFTAGADIVRWSPVDRDPLNEDDLIAFGRLLAAHEHLARFALVHWPA